ncbi:MAG: hypothetical protein IJY12_03820 [Clostridia bacterium]|nr:hypothetical protein [Clostridia bacterium]
MCKCFEMIKKFREGNRVMIESDCHRTVLLRRKEESAPICKIEVNNKEEKLLFDVLAVLGAAWAVCRVTDGIRRLFR